MTQNEKIFIQDGNTVIELSGTEKEAFIADRAEVQSQFQAKEQEKTERQTKLDSAITKLKALGLTESEAKIIIGLE